MEKIKQVMESKDFIQLMTYVKITMDNKYNFKYFKLFKQDFWKEFI